MSKRGLRFIKADLHVHTPGSKCFRESATPEDIINEAVSKGLDAIAITDHNTGVWIDSIKEATNGRIAVFPGVEISCPSGKESYIHIIALFDISKTSSFITGFLGTIGIIDEGTGREDVYAKKVTLHELFEKIREAGGLAISAHCNSSHGILHDMTGQPRIDAIIHPDLSAAECTDYYDTKKKASQKRAADFLSGKDPHYKRKLAVYQASDCIPEGKTDHELSGIGQRWTYFKVDEISLEGLRQCFNDPDTRIVQMHDMQYSVFPKIDSLSTSGGFLAGNHFDFHEGYNAILGGKGVGKSLAIEYIRFALNQQSSIENIRKDYSSKIAKRLGPGESVTLYVTLASGKRYRVVRIHDGQKDPITVTDEDTGEKYEGRVEDLFPLLAYSQTEIIDITNNKNAQLELIDKFIDSSKYKRDSAEILSRLSDSDSEIAESIKSIDKLKDLRQDLADIERQLNEVEIALHSQILKDYRLWDKRSKHLQKHFEYHDSVISWIKESIKAAKKDLVVPKTDSEIMKCDQIIEAKSISSEALGKLTSSLEEILGSINSHSQKMEALEDCWNKDSQEIVDLYKDFIEQRGEIKALETRRKQFEGRKAEINDQIAKFDETAKAYDDLKINRNKLLDELDKTAKDFSEARSNSFERIAKQSKGKLELSVEHQGDRTAFFNELSALKKGTNIREDDIRKVVKAFTPRDFVDAVISESAKKIAKTSEIKEDNAEKLVKHLSNLEAFDEVLSLQHKVYPEDVPSIKFKKPDGLYHDLDSLSVGQKCSALVIIALSEGDMPIIIDQPEDSLDIKSVWEDVVETVRGEKARRQFIFTTHNSNIAVASDADKFHILDSSSDRCSVVCNGAIDRDDVKQSVLKHLEGGNDPYELRRKKYNL